MRRFFLATGLLALLLMPVAAQTPDNALQQSLDRFLMCQAQNLNHAQAQAVEYNKQMAALIAERDALKQQLESLTKKETDSHAVPEPK